MIFFFPEAMQILNPYIFNDFHFFGNIIYTTTTLSIEEFFSLDDSIYNFFISKKDLRINFFVYYLINWFI